MPRRWKAWEMRGGATNVDLWIGRIGLEIAMNTMGTKMVRNNDDVPELHDVVDLRKEAAKEEPKLPPGVCEVLMIGGPLHGRVLVLSKLAKWYYASNGTFYAIQNVPVLLFTYRVGVVHGVMPSIDVLQLMIKDQNLLPLSTN